MSMWTLTSWSMYSKSASLARKGAAFWRTPVLRLSMHTTRQPSERSLSQRWLPMKPAPPVTNARGFLVADLAPVIATSESPVADACSPDLSRVQGVAAIDYEVRLVHQGGHALQVKLAELLPLGDDY